MEQNNNVENVNAVIDTIKEHLCSNDDGKVCFCF